MAEQNYLELAKKNSFFYNPRDPYRFLNLLPDEIRQKAESDSAYRERLRKAFMAGFDREYYQTLRAFNSDVHLISRIVRFKFSEGKIVAQLQNRVKISFEPKMIAKNPDDLYNLLKGYFYVHLRDDQLVSIKPLEPSENTEIAKELFEKAEAEHELYKLLLKGFGYDVTKMNAHDMFFALPRVITLFRSHVTNRNINAIIISNRGTGKTTTSLILVDVFGYFYYTEMPTLANLVYDAKSRMLGAVFVSNGLIFDEIQNWQDLERNQQLYGVNSVLSTGLENCVWSRGAGGSKYYSLLQKCIPILYSGNPLDLNVETDAEAYMMGYKIFSSALLDRIHIIHIAYLKTYDQIIDRLVLYPSVLRSLVHLIQNKIDSIGIGKLIDCQFKGRRNEQALDLQNIFIALDVFPEGREDVCEFLKKYMRYSYYHEGLYSEVL